MNKQQRDKIKQIKKLCDELLEHKADVSALDEIDPEGGAGGPGTPPPPPPPPGP